MNVTEYSIRHRITIYVLAALVLLLGVSSYTSLPRESFPEIEIPLIVVYTSYLGVAPADMETLITRPIETELKAITGVKEIRSTSSEGLSSIEVEFNPDVNLDTALQKVREKVDLSQRELPADLEEDPRVQDVDFSQIPILVVNLSGDVGLVELKEVAEDIKDGLETIGGVNRVQVIGGREREVHVYVDPRRLSAYELSLTDVVQTIGRENLTIPGGEIDIGRLKYLVRVPAEVEMPSEIGDFVVKVRDGIPIYVRDIAAVIYGFEDESTRARIATKPAVTLTIEKRTGANIIEVADQVKAELDRWGEMLPATIDVAIVGDQSKDIRSMVSELENNIVAGLILVVAVLMAFLGLRNSLFVAVAIPLSMLISFIVIQFMGYTLNMIVLFSLILVLGMLVDNAIVIVENIYRHREAGEDGPTASLAGTREVVAPVISSTITTCCAFAPMLVWPGIVGDFMSYLPVTLIIGLTASLVVALVFNPTFTAYFMASPKLTAHARTEGRVLPAYERLLQWVLAPAAQHGDLTWFLRNWLLMGLFGMGLAAGIALVLLAFTIEPAAGPLMQAAGVLMMGAGAAFALQGALWVGWTIIRRPVGLSPYITDRRSGVLWAMGAILIATAVAYGTFGRGVEFFPEMEPRQIWVDLEAPSGTNLETSDDMVRQVETFNLGLPDVVTMIANVGSTGISLQPGGGGGSVGTTSRVTIDLEEHKRRTQNSLTTLEQVRENIARISGAEIKVDRPQEGPPTGKPISIRVIGEELDVLGRLSKDILDDIRTVPGAVNLDDDFDEGKPEIRVHVDRVEAALAGVNTSLIAGTIQTAVRGVEASQYRIGEDEYDIRVRLSPERRASLEELGNLTVPDEDGIPIPIRTIATLQTGVGPAAVHRVDLKRVVMIEGDVVRAPGRTEDSVRAAVAARLDRMEFPPGYRWEFAGSNQEEDESQAFLQQAFVIAVMLIVLVLVTQFNSLILPATVMVSVVLSLIGVLWGLMLTGTAFGIIMTGIGVISLAGIVVNNAIVLCDFIVQLREQGVEKTTAVVRAGKLRFRPVMLTTVTTILGLIPLTLGLNIGFFDGTFEYGAESSQWWGPMGVAVIFGLGVATILTLVVVPVTYHTLDEFSGMLATVPGRLRTRRRTYRPSGEPGAEPAGAVSRRQSSGLQAPLSRPGDGDRRRRSEDVAGDWSLETGD